MDAKQLGHFVTISETGSFNKAAAHLNISQAGLTKSIQRLEQRLGGKLFRRGAKGSELTVLGTQVLSGARLILHECERIFEMAERLEKGGAAEIKMGAGPVWTPGVLPRAIAQFRDLYPMAEFHVIQAYPDMLHNMVKSGEIEFAISGLHSRLESEMEYRLISSSDYAVFARQNHPLTERQKIDLKDLLEFEWILPPRHTGIFDRLEALFLSAGLDYPRATVSTNSEDLKRSLVRSTNALTLASTAVRDAYRREGLVEVENGGVNFSRPSGAYWRKGRRLRRTSVRFLHIVEQISKGFAGL